MRVHPIFFVSLLLSAQVAQETWIQPIEALIRSGDLTQAHQRLRLNAVKWVSLNCAIFLVQPILKKGRLIPGFGTGRFFGRPRSQYHPNRCEISLTKPRPNGGTAYV
jgi:hypothetical protein